MLKWAYATGLAEATYGCESMLVAECDGCRYKVLIGRTVVRVECNGEELDNFGLLGANLEPQPVHAGQVATAISVATLHAACHGRIEDGGQ